MCLMKTQEESEEFLKLLLACPFLLSEDSNAKEQVLVIPSSSSGLDDVCGPCFYKGT